MKKHKNFELMNHWGTQRKPFLFVIDYLCENIFLFPVNEAANQKVYFEINENRNFENLNQKQVEATDFSFRPTAFADYKKSFDFVKEQIAYGNSYLCNLTFAGKIDTSLSLKEIFQYAKAPYKLLFKNDFVVFSPESFIRICNNMVSSFPMKGTISAEKKENLHQLLNDEKEIAEHNTIVDLIRNDLGMIAENIQVKKYRFVDKIMTNQKALYQTSSEITGEMGKGWQNHLGDIFHAILPAGSISGAPKSKTMDIIQEAEVTPRNYYTGIFGLFDGENLESAVMIRFIANKEGDFFYHSGGGITINSQVENEYNELIQKAYFPFV